MGTHVVVKPNRRGRRVAALVAMLVVVGAGLYFSGVLSGCFVPKTRIAVKQQYRGPATRVVGVEDWPQLRGPRNDQISRETGLLEKWPDEGLKVLWSAEVGLGYSSPVAAGGKVFLFSMNDQKETLTAFDAATGAILWSKEGGEGWITSYRGTRATPTVDGDRVYTFGGRGELICRRTGDGGEVWRANVLEMTGNTNVQWGMASSPTVDDKHVYVQAGKGGPVAVAVDKMSGKLAWRSQATGTGGYAKVIEADVGGARQLIVFAGEAIYGVTPADGTTLWSHVWRTSYDVNASTPLYDPATRRVFLTSAYNHGGIVLQLSAGGATPVWENGLVQGKFQGAILDGGYLYANSEVDGGTAALVCVSWADGSLKWKADSKFRLGMGGSIVRFAGSKMMVGQSERGKLVLMRATPEGISKVSESEGVEGKEVWATPLVYGGRLYAKGEKELVCYEVGGDVKR
ncbi:MAG TPA: PQQ-binding-like beta-propeller repeat protein [Tepidisphaeraceae bacterium]|nr:PQQ-binding-like beta-propeller repeat protein [Tepidisphaeraceae bacterium]